tara:strand:+ start:373 stop:1254 length:882 start_codon:yes stop_codon:yes gene_type:complete
MKIISWDIGIKNLAYCILESSNDNKIPFKIYDWQIINSSENIYNYKCYKCDKSVTYKCKLLDKNYYFCNIHKFDFDKIINNNINNFKKEDLVRNECDIINTKSNIKCNKKSKFINNNNKCYCNYHYNLMKNKILNCKLEKINTNVNKIPIEDIKYNMLKILDNNPELLDIEVVLIENQPTFKNPKMKAIADTLYGWYLIRGKIDKKNNCNIKKILYISPSNKLKVDNDNSILLLKKTKNDTEKYKITKKLSIIYTKQLIENDINSLNILNNNKKKDDLADSFLQGVYYLKCVL